MENDLSSDRDKTTPQNLHAQFDASRDDLAAGNVRSVGLVLAEINSRVSAKIEHSEVEYIDGNRGGSGLLFWDRPLADRT